MARRGRWRRVYPIVYFDALHVKVREDRSVRTRACYLAVGVTVDGDREALGDLVAGHRGREVLAGRPQRPAASAASATS